MKQGGATIKAAKEDGYRDAIEMVIALIDLAEGKHVDWPAVRETLKEKLNANR